MCVSDNKINLLYLCKDPQETNTLNSPTIRLSWTGVTFPNRLSFYHHRPLLVLLRPPDSSWRPDTKVSLFLRQILYIGLPTMPVS